MNIRLFTPEDYPAYVDVLNAANPDWPQTLDKVRYNDENRQPPCRWARWVAEVDGRVVGYSHYLQFADFFHPRKFWGRVDVHPDFQRRGIGAALYAAMEADLRMLDPLEMRCELTDRQTVALAFAAARGFVESGRRIESHLDLAAFDPAPYAERLAAVEAQGIALRSIADLAGDPDRDQKLYELQWAVDQDVPLPDPITKMTFEQFCRNLLYNPLMMHEGAFIAVDGERYIGLSTLLRQGDDLEIDITGVLREYRGRGIAQAIKVRGIVWAKGAGFKRILVVNDPVNAAMLSVNRKLGFAAAETLIWLVKRFALDGA